MATIIAARLQLKAQAEEVVHQLVHNGFVEDKIAHFYVNPPGQHAAYPIGGDRYQSPSVGNSDANTGYVAQVMEAMIGVPPGADTHSSQPDRLDAGGAADVRSNETVSVRRAGMMVAAEVTDPASQSKLVALLAELGANDIETAEGEIVNGQWNNFDPLSQPHYII